MIGGLAGSALIIAVTAMFFGIVAILQIKKIGHAPERAKLHR
ncbi:MAG: hypothetical protein P8M22_13235 [Phycisphaerales bacterium]|nr:hypothetical protein [Phycisphaerales bacterium]